MTFENRYSLQDRWLHKFAFHTPQIQVMLADIESHIFGRRYAALEVSDPVFITAIPRAGTTLLLELLVEQGEFVSHTYRDMPFVLMPLIWDKLSAAFRKSEGLRERAHGDGLQISTDSPEAFEEILWKPFWKDHYEGDCITPWGNESHAEFEEFLHDHIRKILYLRAGGAVEKARYISKNNLNIARVAYLKSVFPGARILVPFRDPLRHARSLHKQHLNFLQVHEQDEFARQYMLAIGHYDFGRNLKPVDFDGWCAADVLPPADTLDFWIMYWTRAYKYLSRHANENLILFDYDAFCEDPESGLSALGECLGVVDCQRLHSFSGRVRRPSPVPVDSTGFSESCISDADAVLRRLRNAAIF